MKKRVRVVMCLSIILSLMLCNSSISMPQIQAIDFATLTAEEIAAYSTVAETFKSGRQPNDTYFFYNQNDMVLMDMTAAWNIRTDASSVKVGVIDSGIQANHPDISPNYVQGGQLYGR